MVCQHPLEAYYPEISFYCVSNSVLPLLHWFSAHTLAHFHSFWQTYSPRCCDTAVMAARSPTRPETAISMMELFLCSVQNSLAHWNKDNVDSFTLSCNYTDLILLSLPRSLVFSVSLLPSRSPPVYFHFVFLIRIWNMAE